MTTPDLPTNVPAYAWCENGQLRDYYLRHVPPEVFTAMRRIHRWAEGSFEARDKLAVDALFTFVAEQQERLENVEDHHDHA